MKRWEILYKDSNNGVNNSFDVAQIKSILLQNRKINESEGELFFNPTLENIEISKLGVSKKAITHALALINNAQSENKTIIIYGDYDVDGVCATAILWETLYDRYKKAIPFIPNRVEEGYGVSKKGIDAIIEKYPDTGLIITVDNGITALDAVSYAKEKGIAVIITDHHAKGKEIPEADAIIYTPKVCGAGVAYAFSRAIEKAPQTQQQRDRHLELVTLATIADCMPLLAENRAIVKHGLQELTQTTRSGLLELFIEAKVKKDEIDVYHVGFMIAPRINATGRLASAMDSLRLLCTKDTMRAKVLAQKLASANKDRQELTALSFEHARTLSVSTDSIIVVADSSYNQGIIGLIASKLTELYNRPSIAIAIGEEGISKGSARSVKGVNIVELLRAVSDHVLQIGGHEMAAGFTIQTDKIDDFKKALQEISQKFITEKHMEKVLLADLELPFEMINYDLYTLIKEFAPFGIQNTEPTFVTQNVSIREVKYLGQEGKHLKLLLEHNGVFLEGLAFRFADRFSKKMGDSCHVLYTVSLDTWNGKKKVVLKVKDLQ